MIFKTNSFAHLSRLFTKGSLRPFRKSSIFLSGSKQNDECCKKSTVCAICESTRTTLIDCPVNPISFIHAIGSDRCVAVEHIVYGEGGITDISDVYPEALYPVTSSILDPITMQNLIPLIESSTMIRTDDPHCIVPFQFTGNFGLNIFKIDMIISGINALLPAGKWTFIIELSGYQTIIADVEIVPGTNNLGTFFPVKLATGTGSVVYIVTDVYVHLPTNTFIEGRTKVSRSITVRVNGIPTKYTVPPSGILQVVYPAGTVITSPENEDYEECYYQFFTDKGSIINVDDQDSKTFVMFLIPWQLIPDNIPSYFNADDCSLPEVCVPGVKTFVDEDGEILFEGDMQENFSCVSGVTRFTFSFAYLNVPVGTRNIDIYWCVSGTSNLLIGTVSYNFAVPNGNTGPLFIDLSSAVYNSIAASVYPDSTQILILYSIDMTTYKIDSMKRVLLKPAPCP